jgi:AAA15 family ATPase/GTPase
MIIYFKVGNFKSINEPVIINFNASSINEHHESNIVEYNNTKLLKTIMMYGHNASGKSKILDALIYFKSFISNSATEREVGDGIKVEPFKLLDENAKKPSSFEIGFFIDKTKYRYGFEADAKKVHKEWLIEVKVTKDTPLFLRIDQEIQIDYRKFPNSELLDKKTRENALFLSVATQWNVKKALLIDNWINSIFVVHGINDREHREITLDLLKNKKYSKIIKKFIQKADLGINDVQAIDFPLKFDDFKDKVPDELREAFKIRLEKKTPQVILTKHNVFNKHNEIIGEETFLLDSDESEGTKKYFNIIGLIVLAILENRLVIIDEFDARLHTLLSKAIIKLFNSNKIHSKAQLLIASHDTALIDRDLLRRDQIYFIEKSNNGSTKAVSLVEYKPRKESPYDKNYLDGKYGGIPFIDVYLS